MTPTKQAKKLTRSKRYIKGRNLWHNMGTANGQPAHKMVEFGEGDDAIRTKIYKVLH